MLRLIRLVSLAAFLVGSFAIEAAAFQAKWAGSGFYKFKEVYEDGEVLKKKKTFDDMELDSSTGTFAAIEFKPGIEIGYPLLGKNDRKALVELSDDPETDYLATEGFLDSLSYRTGLTDVFALKLKYGTLRVNKRFSKAEFEMKIKGSYMMEDGPREGEDVDFTIVIMLPKGKRLPF